MEYDDIDDEEDDPTYDLDNLQPLNIDENTEIMASQPQYHHHHKLSMFSGASDVSTGNDSAPFFARRGSLSITGPSGLRWMQSISHYSSDREITPHSHSTQHHIHTHSPSPFASNKPYIYNVQTDPSSYQPIPDAPNTSNRQQTNQLQQQYFQQTSIDTSHDDKQSLLSPKMIPGGNTRSAHHSFTRGRGKRHGQRRSFSPQPGSQYEHKQEEKRKSMIMDPAPKMGMIKSRPSASLSPDDVDVEGEVQDDNRLKVHSRASRKSVDISGDSPKMEQENQDNIDKERIIGLSGNTSQSETEYTTLQQQTTIDCEWKLENDWKTSWKGIGFIGGIWCASWHCLYSFSVISMSVIKAFDITIFDLGLMYFFTFLGIAGGILLSSIILNQQSMIESSQIIATYSMFVVFLAQAIAAIVCYYVYYYGNTDNIEITTFCWWVVVTSRFLLGFAIGFIETAIDNLLFEWFAIVDELYFANTARPYTLLLREFGHFSARLLLVPFVYLTVSDGENLFFSLLFGVLLSAFSWLSMIYAAVKDSKSKFDRMMSYTNDTKGIAGMVSMSDEELSGLDPSTKPLLDKQRTYSINKNEWMMKSISTDVKSYRKWYDEGFIGFNKSVFLSIIYLSLNFAISFCFIILSILSFVEQYGFTDFTANLVLCLIPFLNVTCSGLIRNCMLSPLQSEWIVAFIGCCTFSTIFSLFAWLNVYGQQSVWLPILCVLLFNFGYECFTAAGYELLLSSTRQDLQGLISGINSSSNYLASAIFVIIFGALVIEYPEEKIYIKYQWSYSFLAFASYFNILLIILLKLCHTVV